LIKHGVVIKQKAKPKTDIGQKARKSRQQPSAFPRSQDLAVSGRKEKKKEKEIGRNRLPAMEVRTPLFFRAARFIQSFALFPVPTLPQHFPGLSELRHGDLGLPPGCCDAGCCGMLSWLSCSPVWVSLAP
jgi:hypothetical protein